MKKSRTEGQLTLNLTFDKPTPAVLRVLATLFEIAEEGHQKRPVQPSVQPFPFPQHEDGKAHDKELPNPSDEELAIRKQIRRLVGCVAIAHGKEWQEVWVMAYHHFNNLHGFHPIASASKNGRKVHLDELFTISGKKLSYPDKLKVILEKMLTDYHYKKA